MRKRRRREGRASAAPSGIAEICRYLDGEQTSGGDRRADRGGHAAVRPAAAHLAAEAEGRCYH